MQNEQQMNQPLNEDGSKKKRMNKLERKAQRHEGAINSFSLSTHSQITSGYVAGTERKPTNIMFCFIFIFFIIGMITISVIGFSKGNYKALIAGVNSQQQICGYSPGVEGFPKTYYFLDDQETLRAECVTVCPKDAEQRFGTDECAGTPEMCMITNGYPTTEILGYCVPNSIDGQG